MAVLNLNFKIIICILHVSRNIVPAENFPYVAYSRSIQNQKVLLGIVIQIIIPIINFIKNNKSGL